MQMRISAIKELVKDLPKVKNSRDLDLLKKKYCKKYKIQKMFSNAEIFGLAGDKYRKLLMIKPVRSSSGVCVVAIMSEPLTCPGSCIYCPRGSNAPQSYTGKEPAARRAIRNKYDSFSQVLDRLNQLEKTGHKPEKIELIVMGGTFLSYPKDYQEKFIVRAYQALNLYGKKIGKEFTLLKQSLEEVKKINETATARCIGMTFETRPDYCKREHINRALTYGGTRVELGIQTIYNEILKKIQRGHDINESIKATQLLKDSGFKVLYHLMPGLPGSNYKKDLEMMNEIFLNPDFKPDMLKIYPTCVVKGTKLYEMFKNKEYKAPDFKETAKLIGEFKRNVPYYCRIMRIQRDIPSTEIIAGIKKTNLREEVKKYCEENDIVCKCIRCREPRLKEIKEKKLFMQNYVASQGTENFISCETPDRKNILGFVRLRIPYKPFRKEITKNTGIIRELHVYGLQTPFGEKEIQHTGIGSSLLKKAEEIALNDFSCRKMAIISGTGVREYYRRFNYSLEGAYMTKTIY